MSEPSHEARIHQLEQDVTEAKVDHQHVATSLEYIKAQVQESKDLILQKISEQNQVLEDRIGTLSQKIDGVTLENIQQTQDLEIIKKDRATAAERWQNGKKWVFTGLTAGLAIIVKEVVALIIRHM